MNTSKSSLVDANNLDILQVLIKKIAQEGAANSTYRIVFSASVKRQGKGTSTKSENDFGCDKYREE